MLLSLNRFFESGFRFKMKLSRKYRDFPYIPCPNTGTAFPVIKIPYQRGTFVIIDKATLIDTPLSPKAHTVR